MVGVPMLKPERFPCSFPEGRRAHIRNVEAIKHIKTARAYQMREALQAVYECETRGGEAETELNTLCSWIMHSNVPPPDEEGRQDAAQKPRRSPELLRPQAHQRRARGNELGDPVIQEAGARLQEPGVLQDHDIREARETGLPAAEGLCHPLGTVKGQT